MGLISIGDWPDNIIMQSFFQDTLPTLLEFEQSLAKISLYVSL